MARPKSGSPSKKQQRGMKKAKKVKDPNAPKKPTTAFFYFVKSRRESGHDQGMKVAEFTKECGALWRGDSLDKGKFEKLAAADRERYEKEMRIYKPAGGAGAHPDDPPKPKKAATAFILFANAKRPDLMAEGFSAKEVLQEAGRLWKDMDDTDKEEFTSAAAEDKERYEAEMVDYNKGLRNAGTKKNGAKKAPPKKEESDEEDEDDDDDVESDDE